MDDVLDRIGAQLRRAEQAPPPGVGASPARHSRRWRARRWLHRPLVVAVVLVGASGSAGGLALAGTFSGGSIDPQAWVEGQRVTPEAAMTADQTADLEILRRPRVASDALPQADISDYTASPTAANGPNVALSRSAQGFSGGDDAWLVPGNGMICFNYDDPGAGGGGSCGPDAFVNEGRMLLFGGYTAAHPLEAVGGVVPDGVTQVTLETTQGTTITVPVHENVYIATLSGMFASMTFQGPNGPVTVSNS